MRLRKSSFKGNLVLFLTVLLFLSQAFSTVTAIAVEDNPNPAPSEEQSISNDSAAPPPDSQPPTPEVQQPDGAADSNQQQDSANPAGEINQQQDEQPDSSELQITQNNDPSSKTSNSGQTDFRRHHPHIPKLSISKSANPASGSYVKPGDIITYTLNYSNTSAFPAPGTVISDAIPADTSLVGGSITGGGTESGGVITWNIGNLAAGASGSVSFQVVVSSVSKGTVILNKGSIDSALTSPVESNETSHTVCRPSLSISKSASPESGSNVSPGDEIKYTISYQNTSNVTATGVVIEDSVPANTTLVEGSITGGGSVSGGIITWSIGDVEAGQSGSVSFTVTVNSDAGGETIINAANLRADEIEEIKSNETSHPVNKPITEQAITDLWIEKIGPKNANPGQEITYKVNYANLSDKPATGVIIEDTLPDNVAVTDSGGGLVSGNMITWNIGDMAPGQTGSIIYKVVVGSIIDESTNDDLTLVNRVKIKGDGEEITLENNESSTETEVEIETLEPKETPDITSTGTTAQPAQPSEAKTANNVFPATGLGNLFELLRLLSLLTILSGLFFIRRIR